MSNLGRIAGRDLPDQPLSLSARLVGSPKALTLQEFSLTAGPSDLAGTATYDTSAELPLVDVDLQSRYLDPTPFLPAEADRRRAGDRAAAGRRSPDPGHAVAGRLAERAERAGQGVNRRTDPAERAGEGRVADGSLQDGALRIERFALTGDRGTLAGELQVLPDASGFPDQREYRRHGDDAGTDAEFTRRTSTCCRATTSR